MSKVNITRVVVCLVGSPISSTNDGGFNFSFKQKPTSISKQLIAFHPSTGKVAITYTHTQFVRNPIFPIIHLLDRKKPYRYEKVNYNTWISNILLKYHPVSIIGVLYSLLGTTTSALIFRPNMEYITEVFSYARACAKYFDMRYIEI
jgi:hypothetical protein